MAEDLTLAVILKTILDAKGFEDAQAALKGFTGAANSAQAPVKGLSKELGGSRGAVADMTRVLLLNIGVTGAAGETAKAAGLAMTSLGGAVSPVTLVATGLVAAAALLVPKLIEWAKSTKDTEQATKELKEGLIGLLPELEDYVRQVPNATAELKALFEVSKDEALRKQKKEIADLTEAISANEKEVAKLVASTQEIVIENRRSGASHTIVKEATEENKAKAAELTITLDEQRAKLNALLAAQEDGVTLGGQIKSGIDREREARERATKALAEKNREEERARQLRLDTIVESGRLQEDEKKRRAEMHKLDEENKRTAAERILLLEKEKGAYIEVARTAVQARKDQAAADAEHLASSASYYLSFFGNSKAVRIAQAITDTYAAATRALAEFPVPYSYIIAAAVTAAGLANVANIRKQEVGFDDPFNDLLAEKLGRKSAADFVRYFGMGFQGGMASAGTTNTYQTTQITNNNGMTVGSFHSSAIVGSKATQQLVDLNRELKQIDRRIERRTKIGG